MSGFAVVCSGQGTQNAEMFKIFRRIPEAEAFLRSAEEVLPPQAIAFLKNPSEDPSLIFQNETAQPLICLWQITLWKILKPLLPEPDLFAGYSVGELSAFACAGAFSAQELVRLASKRGEIMSRAAKEPQTMAAVKGLSRRIFDQICAKTGAHPAIINGDDHLIAGMRAQSYENFKIECERNNAQRIIKFNVTIASHTPFMNAAAEDLRKELSEADIKENLTPALSGTRASPAQGKNAVIEALSSLTNSPVLWADCMEMLADYGCKTVLELGPGNSLSKMISEKYPDINARSAADFHDPLASARWAKSAAARQL